MWGMAEAFSRRQRMWGTSWYFTYTYAHDSYHWLLLLQAILYYSTSLLIINYCHTEPYTTNCDNCFDTERPTTPSGQQLSSTTALPLKTLIHVKTRLIFAINHRFTHCPRAYCKKLQHRYIELAKREIYWDKDNVLRIWGRNAITLQLYRKRIKAMRAW